MRVALFSTSLLLVPLVAMEITDEVDWGVGDFVVGAILLSGAGVTYTELARGRSGASRAAVGAAVIAALFAAWATLAVGLG